MRLRLFIIICILIFCNSTTLLLEWFFISTVKFALLQKKTRTTTGDFANNRILNEKHSEIDGFPDSIYELVIKNDLSELSITLLNITNRLGYYNEYKSDYKLATYLSETGLQNFQLGTVGKALECYN